MDALKALAAFRAVAEHGSFVGASNSLDLSRAVITRDVQDLEELLGIRLLHRTTRRVSVTPAGEDVLNRAKVILQSFDDLAAVVRMQAMEPTGKIRLAAPASFARRFLGPILAGYRARFPKVVVETLLHESWTDWPLEDADITICGDDDLRPAMIARPLTRIDLALCAAPSYIRERGAPSEPCELRTHDCLTASNSRRASSWRFSEMAGPAQTSVEVDGVLHSDQIEVLKDAAIHGAGIALLPVFAIEDCVANGTLQRIMTTWRIEPQQVHVAYHSRLNQPAALRELVAYLLATFSEAAGSASPPVLRLIDRHASDGPVPSVGTMRTDARAAA
jgi:DNA-binding transcriptional LysR family regulator